MADKTNARIESEIEVKAYIQDLKFALNNGAKINFQVRRLVDELGVYGNATTFVMSFHFAEREFTPEMFPYKKN